MSNQSSLTRKRALRRLSHEQPDQYRTLYEQVMGEAPGLTREAARGRTWTLLGHRFPDRYVQLYGIEKGGTSGDVPPDIRTKAWQRASARLAAFRQPDWEARYDEFRGQGMPPPKAYDRAIAVIRAANVGSFTRPRPRQVCVS